MTADQRQNDILNWLNNDCGYTVQEITSASADASFRRYFRAITDKGTFIIMDAPPEKEDCQPFISAAQALSKLKVHTPEIIAHDLEHGFIVLEDLGNRTYLDELKDNSASLYSDAINALIKIQSKPPEAQAWSPPNYTNSKLAEEMSLFEHWFINKHLGKSLDPQSNIVWQQTQELIVDAFAEQPQVWVHRDFHSRNLMITDERSPGVIDFQDIVTGAIGYDLASIFKDCYIEWPRQQQHLWLEEYRLKAIAQLELDEFSLESLVRWVDFAGLQRHLKVLGIFCRLSYRDAKHDYLNDLPLVAKYTLEVLDIYPELASFKKHFSTYIKAATATRL